MHELKLQLPELPPPPPPLPQRRMHCAPFAQSMLLQSFAPRQSMSQLEPVLHAAWHCEADPHSTVHFALASQVVTHVPAFLQSTSQTAFAAHAGLHWVALVQSYWQVLAAPQAAWQFVAPEQLTSQVQLAGQLRLVQLEPEGQIVGEHTPPWHTAPAMQPELLPQAMPSFLGTLEHAFSVSSQ
jgi:hypothetical protein